MKETKLKGCFFKVSKYSEYLKDINHNITAAIEDMVVIAVPRDATLKQNKIANQAPIGEAFSRAFLNELEDKIGNIILCVLYEDRMESIDLIAMLKGKELRHSLGLCLCFLQPSS